MAGTDQQGTGSQISRALLNTTNIVVLGSSGVLSALSVAVVNSLPVAAGVGALGLAAYAALVAMDLSGPRPPARPGLPAGPALPAPSSLRDPALKATVAALVQVRQEIGRILQDTPDHVRDHVRPALLVLPELEERAVHLIARSEDLLGYLQTQDPDRVRDEHDKIGKAAKGARDRAAREEFGRALDAKREQIQALDDIAGARERVQANLARIVAGLEALPPRMVRMRALDGQALDEVGGDVSRELDQMNGEIRMFEESLKQVAAGGL